jgi:hypothetical protein
MEGIVEILMFDGYRVLGVMEWRSYGVEEFESLRV